MFSASYNLFLFEIVLGVLSMKSINPSQTAAWRALEQHYAEMKNVHMRDLFAQDAQRFTKFSATFDDQILVDFSKTVLRKTH